MDVSIIVDEHLVRNASAPLYSAALRQPAPDTLRALERASQQEKLESARATLDLMVRSEQLPAMMAQLASRRAAAQPTDTRED